MEGVGLGTVCLGVEWKSIGFESIELYDVPNESGDTIFVQNDLSTEFKSTMKHSIANGV